jgi:hypothetical protein
LIQLLTNFAPLSTSTLFTTPPSSPFNDSASHPRTHSKSIFSSISTLFSTICVQPVHRVLRVVNPYNIIQTLFHRRNQNSTPSTALTDLVALTLLAVWVIRNIIRPQLLARNRSRW